MDHCSCAPVTKMCVVESWDNGPERQQRYDGRLLHATGGIVCEQSEQKRQEIKLRDDYSGMSALDG